MPFTVPRPGNKDYDDQLGKDDLVDALIVVNVLDYDPEKPTRYGLTPTLKARVVVVDGQHKGTVEPEFFAAGNLARQIGEALDVGGTCPGRIRKGKSSNGREWYGIEWALDEQDQTAAEAALKVSLGQTPTPATAKQTIAEEPPF